MIPVYLTAFNELTWLREMVRQVARLGGRPIILDNGSDYPPLLEWLDDSPFDVVRLGGNHGCYAFWRLGLHRNEPGFYVVSDADLDLSRVPGDALAVLQDAFRLNPAATKAGLSLEINDLPDCYPFREDVHTWEDRYWTRRGEGPPCFVGQVGATFALYHRDRDPDSSFYPAVRLDRPYTARHLPWYLDPLNLSDELKYYYKTAIGPGYWTQKLQGRINAQG